MGPASTASPAILWRTWLALSLLHVVVDSTHVRDGGVVVLRRPCGLYSHRHSPSMRRPLWDLGSPDISWHDCVVKKGCSWDNSANDAVHKGQSRCYRAVRRTSSDASSRLRTMCSTFSATLGEGSVDGHVCSIIWNVAKEFRERRRSCTVRYTQRRPQETPQFAKVFKRRQFWVCWIYGRGSRRDDGNRPDI